MTDEFIATDRSGPAFKQTKQAVEYTPREFHLFGTTLQPARCGIKPELAEYVHHWTSR
jgi:hypothetical protein